MKGNEDLNDREIILKESKPYSNNQNTQIDPIYVMALKLENGTKKNIKIYSNSNPAELAFEFCKEHNLDFSALNNLTHGIESIKKKLTAKRETNSKETTQSIKKDETGKDQYQFDSLTKTEGKNSTLTERYTAMTLEKQMIDTITLNKTESNVGTKNNNPSMHSSNISISKKLSQDNIDHLKEAQLIYNSKLFMYEFNHEKTKKIIKRGKTNDHQTINTQHNHNQSISATKSIPNINSSSRLSSLSVYKQKPELIYERLFREAAYSKIIAKRKCHFSRSITSYSHANNNNSQFSLMTETDSIASNSIINMITSNNAINKECTFKPFISVQKATGYSNKKKQIGSHKRNLISLNEILDYNNVLKNSQKPKIISNNNKNENHSNVYNTLSIISTENRHVKNSRTQSYNESYISIKEKYNISQLSSNSKGDTYLEGIRREAFENLFNELIKDKSSEILSKETLDSSRISKAISQDINSILTMVITDNKELTKNDFADLMMELFKSLSLEGKRNIIRYYHYHSSISPLAKDQASIVINKDQVQKNESKYCFFNSKTIAKPSLNRNYHGIRRDGRDESKSEKATSSEKQRNFYYLF